MWLHTHNSISCQTEARRDVSTRSRKSNFQIFDSLKRFQLTFGYLECLGQPSMATMILWPTSVDACRVSMRMRGIRRSAGVKRWRVDWRTRKEKGWLVHRIRDKEVLDSLYSIQWFINFSKNAYQLQIFKPSKIKLFDIWSLCTSLIWEAFSMPQNGLQLLLMIPTTLPVGFLAASAANILNCSDTQEHGRH